MSRYDHQAADTDNPQAAHQDAGSGTPSTAADTGTESDIAAWLTNLRSTIRMDPWRAVAYLHRLTDPTIGTTPRPAHRADAIILTAETHARLRNTAAALVAARGGLRAARDLQPADPRRLTVALGVLADIAVSAGAPQALEACLEYIEAAYTGPRTDQEPDDHRTMLATALFAVATYHTNCTNGRNLLSRMLDLQRSKAPSGGAATMAAALTTMHTLCGGTHQKPGIARLPVPLPGGLLHQALHDPPPPDYLTDRIHARPAQHTCPAHTPTAASDAE